MGLKHFTEFNTIFGERHNEINWVLGKSININLLGKT